MTLHVRLEVAKHHNVDYSQHVYEKKKKNKKEDQYKF